MELMDDLHWPSYPWVIIIVPRDIGTEKVGFMIIEYE